MFYRSWKKTLQLQEHQRRPIETPQIMEYARKFFKMQIAPYHRYIPYVHVLKWAVIRTVIIMYLYSLRHGNLRKF